MPSDISDRSRLVALLLAIPLGLFGAHRFYVGKVKSGILMAVTLGGLGLWYLYDLILVAAGGFRDNEGRLLLSWELEERPRPRVPDELASDLLEAVDSLRREVAELTERVDYSERLLADPTRPRRTPDQSS